MPLKKQEIIPALRIIVAMAKADGRTDESERAALKNSLAGAALPDGETIDDLLAVKIDAAREMRRLKTKEAKEMVYQAAMAMAYADGRCTPAEQKLLDDLRTEFGLHEGVATETRNLANEIEETLLQVSSRPIPDPRKRDEAIEGTVRRYAVVAAALGAFPIPVVDFLLNTVVVALHTKMFNDVARTYGRTATAEQAKSLLAGAGAGTGARIAIVSLSKFIPGWGSLVGAATNFAVTYGLGKVAQRFYSVDGTVEVSAAELRKIFESAEKEGRDLYKTEQSQIEKAASAIRPKLEELVNRIRRQEVSATETDDERSRAA